MEMNNTIQMNLFTYFMDNEQFTIKEATELVNNVKKMGVNNESVRARVYEGVDKGLFKKISRGVYKVVSQIDGKETSCLLINGDGRDLSSIPDGSIDGIITDHPYLLEKSLKGGNRDFASYELFKYNEKDFKEKNRVLKEGSFLVEFLPEESEINYDYLYQIKEMAKKQGFKYYAKVPWIKGDFKANTGRKSKNSEDVMIFSKGEARALKLDNKKNIATAKKQGIDVKGKNSYEIRDILEKHGLAVSFMKGTNGMLPTQFSYNPKPIKEKINEAEKPIELLEKIINYITKPYECILDQFAGSGNLGIASLNTNRNAILIEKDEEMYEKMKKNVEVNVTMKNIENKREYLKGVTVRDLAESDRERCEGLGFEYLLESKSKIFEIDDLYIIISETDYELFGKEKLCNVVYKEHSNITEEDVLRIDFAKIANDIEFNKPITIDVEFVENVEGTNDTIFKAIGKEKYYIRQDDKRENYAKWYSAFKDKGIWQDNATIRANVTFRLKNEIEKVSYSNWNGAGVSSKDYNEKFSYDYLKLDRSKIRADREFIKNLIDVGSLDDIKELKTAKQYNDAVDYWVEHYFDDYSDQELNNEIKNNNSGIVIENVDEEENR